jgi:hypothetical protein
MDFMVLKHQSAEIRPVRLAGFFMPGAQKLGCQTILYGRGWTNTTPWETTGISPVLRLHFQPPAA